MIGGIRAEHVVTVSGPTFSPGWIAHEAGVIVGVGGGSPPHADLTAAPAGAIVIPGLVSAHTHLALGRLRGCADDLPFLDWLNRGLMPAIGAAASDPAFFREGARLSARELLEAGVTTVADNFFRDDGVAALRETGQRGVFFHEVFGSFSPDEDAYWGEVSAALDAAAARADGFPFGYSPHTPWTCPKRTLLRTAERARSEGRRISLHLDESPDEHAFFMDARGRLHDAYAKRGTLARYDFGESPTRYLARLGVLGPDVIAAHGVQLDAEDVQVFAASGASMVHCPQSNLKLAEGVAPVRALLAAGVNVALGVDSAASVSKLDLFDEMRAALLVQRGAAREVGPLTAATALRMATVNGARALGMADRIGALEIGKAADYVVLDASSPRHAPRSDPVAAVVWTCGARDVAEVVIGGVVRHRRGASA